MQDYVYDLYYTPKNVEDMVIEKNMLINAYDESFVYDQYREKGLMDSDHEGESEDSNSESNWKNDYPDSDHSENSIVEDDMRDAVEKIKIDGEGSDLSSEDEDFAYGVDKSDLDYFGYDYAKYKAKLKKEWGEGESGSSTKESSESEGIGDLDDWSIWKLNPKESRCDILFLYVKQRKIYSIRCLVLWYKVCKYSTWLLDFLHFLFNVS